MSRFASRRTHGSVSDLVGQRAKKMKNRCATPDCGVTISDAKTYCGPCRADRAHSNRAEWVRRNKRAKGGASP
jgi:hypothetical protein